MSTPSFVAEQAPLLQRSPLRVGAVDDPLEREADAVADRVMRMPAPDVDLIQRCPGGCPDDGGQDDLVRRQPLDEVAESLHRAPASQGASAVTPKTGSTIMAQRSGGAPLPASTRRFFPGSRGAAAWP
jgi:hypothetical protein